MKPTTPDIKIPIPASSTVRTFELIDAAYLLKPQAAPSYLVDGLIEAGVIAGAVAPPESCKSLLLQHVGACVATGADFHGRKVKRGLVAYLCGEGHHGIARRLQALEHHYRLGIADAALVVSQCAAPLIEPLEADRVREAIKTAETRHGLPLTLLIVDTLARFLAPGDESKAPDMGALLAAVDALRGNATAIIAHHPGHGDATRGRGSSAWRAALDTEYCLAKDGEVITLTVQKMKDGERPAPMSFTLKTVPTLCSREDGTTINSVVLVPTEEIPRPRRRRLTSAQAAGVASYWTAAEEAPQIVGGRFAGLHVEAWRAEFYRTSTADSSAAKKKSFQRLRNDLAAAGLLTVEHDLYRLTTDEAPFRENEIARKTAGTRDISGTLSGHVPPAGTEVPGHTGHPPLGVSRCPAVPPVEGDWPEKQAKGMRV